MKNLILIILFLGLVIHIKAQEIHENILENKTYKERIEYFKSHPLEENQIIFLGNSLTQGGKWDEYFPIVKPINRGISGDNTLGILARLNEIIEAKPRKLFMMLGTNDISLSRSNDKIMTGIKAIVYQIKAASPDTQIYIQSILPVNNDFGKYKRMKDKEKQIEGLNTELKKLAKEEDLMFIDLYPHFLMSERKLDEKLTTDGIHLNDEGYRVWVDQIQDLVY